MIAANSSVTAPASKVPATFTLPNEPVDTAEPDIKVKQANVVDSTVVARMKREDVIDNANIKAGNVIVGLSSFGQANYETEYNAGMGSNGLTSARHDVFSKILSEKYPESYDPSVPDELVYSGTKKLTDKIGDTGLDAGKLVLSPTRTYAPIIKDILDKYRSEINGMVHCSGGAQTKVLHFVNDVHVIKDNLFDIPPLFKMIQEIIGKQIHIRYENSKDSVHYEVTPYSFIPKVGKKLSPPLHIDLGQGVLRVIEEHHQMTNID